MPLHVQIRNKIRKIIRENGAVVSTVGSNWGEHVSILVIGIVIFSSLVYQCPLTKCYSSFLHYEQQRSIINQCSAVNAQWNSQLWSNMHVL